MSKETYQLRRDRLRQLMCERNINTLLVGLDANRYYLSGFELHDAQINESSGKLIICADGKDKLCTDPRFYDCAKKLWDEENIVIYRGNAEKEINNVLRSIARGPIGFEAHNTTVAFLNDVSAGLDMKPADGLVEGLRTIKDHDEIQKLKAACALNHKLMEWMPTILQPGKTEKAIAWEIEQFFRNNGAEELAFSSIVARGPNAALPHAIPSEAVILENDEVLIDVGCRLNDYCSDQTRTFWVGGAPSSRHLEHYEYILEAQQRAIQAIKPGVPASAIDAAARSYLESKGVAHLFTHGLGHGIGLQTHESPSISPKSSVILQPGMVITIEPGLYCSNEGGIRHEYMVLVTENGSLIL